MLIDAVGYITDHRYRRQKVASSFETGMS